MKLKYYGIALATMAVPVPSAPGSTLVKFDQSRVTFGSSVMSSVGKLAPCSALSVFSKVAWPVISICVWAVPTVNCASP